MIFNGVHVDDVSYNDNDNSNGHFIEHSDDRLPFWKMLFFAVGHFYNDMCASMWFTYMMLFLQNVLLFPSYWAGFVMLIGQVSDAISTPLVGIFSDKMITVGTGLGTRRKHWHAIGTLLVTVSFPFLYNKCLFCTSDSSFLTQLLLFIPFVVVSQIGWASVQISHLAMIPEMSRVESHRYAFTVLANLTVFGILTYFLASSQPYNSVGPVDFVHFRNTAYIVVAIGLYFVVFFHFSTKEKPRDTVDSQFLTTNTSLMTMTLKSWFCLPQFYQMFPAALKRRSLGTLVGGADKYFHANLDIFGNRI